MAHASHFPNSPSSTSLRLTPHHLVYMYAVGPHVNCEEHVKKFVMDVRLNFGIEEVNEINFNE